MDIKHGLLAEEINKHVQACLLSRTRHEIVEIWAKFRVFLKKSGYKDRSVKTIIAKIRKQIKNNLQPDLYKAHVRRLQWVNEIIVNDAKTLEKVKKSDLKNFKKRRNSSDNVVNDFKGMLAQASKMINSYSYSDITLGLALLTGRRTIELLKTGTFKYVDKDHVKFSGQAKKREKVSKAYTIPVLNGQAKEVCKALELLRKVRDFSQTENEEVHNIVSSNLNKAVRKNFENYSPKLLHVHDLRKIYASYCLEKVRGNDKYIKEMNRRYFLGLILGHYNEEEGNTNSISNGERYEDFIIHE